MKESTYQIGNIKLLNAQKRNWVNIGYFLKEKSAKNQGIIKPNDLMAFVNSRLQ
jgi:hypothetical protein